MAKKDAPKEVGFNDESLKEAFASGDASKLPDNVTIASPYGAQPDAGVASEDEAE